MERCRTEKHELTEALLAQVRERSKAGEFQGTIVDWKDVKLLTFNLRARGTSLSFLYRTRQRTVKVGDAWNMTALAARFGCGLVEAAIERGENPKKHLDILKQNLNRTANVADAFQDTLISTDPNWNKGVIPGWSVADLRRFYLDDILPGMRNRSGKQVESFLMAHEMNAIANKQVSQIDLRDLQDLLIEMERAGQPLSRRWRTIQHIKSMLLWGATKQARKTNLNPQNDWWRWVKIDYKSAKNSNEPSLEDLVRTILVAEELAEDHENPVEPGLIGVLWASILLGQRINQIVSMKPSRLLPDIKPDEFRYDRLEQKYDDRTRPELGQDWRIYTWTSQEMKQAQAHALPIPPRALTIIMRYQIPECPDYLFPRGDGNLPCYATAVNRLFYRMRGCAPTGGYKLKPERPGKPGPKP
ncbi:MAG: hypothetical protein WAP03_02680 [Methylorubrum rhodinum]|uniref:hypothetical protein n=1 Tax=Methylorubrum rhodinum TaxID=29428 RepID=UPI003BAFE89A